MSIYVTDSLSKVFSSLYFTIELLILLLLTALLGKGIDHGAWWKSLPKVDRWWTSTVDVDHLKTSVWSASTSWKPQYVQPDWGFHSPRQPDWYLCLLQSNLTTQRHLLSSTRNAYIPTGWDILAVWNTEANAPAQQRTKQEHFASAKIDDDRSWTRVHQKWIDRANNEAVALSITPWLFIN